MKIGRWGEVGVVFFLTTLWSFFLYRYSRYGVEGALYMDHMVFMAQRGASSNEWEFLWRVISFDRVRVQGSVYLFRPGLGAYLWLLDQWFRPFFTWWGGASLLLHSIVGTVVYAVLRTLFDWKRAGLFVFIFMTLFSGSDAILWRHVSPYLWGVVFFGGALFLVGRAIREGRRPNLIPVVVCLFVSSLFHENMTYSLIAFLVFIALLRACGWKWEWKEGVPILRSELLLLWAAPLLYFTVNTVDYLIRKPSGSDLEAMPLFRWNLSSIAEYLGTVCFYFFQVVGSFLSAFLIPQVNTMPWEVQKPLFFVTGLLLTLAVLFLFFKMLRNKTVRGESILGWWVASYLFVLSFTLAAVRLGQIGFFYLGRSRYYQYFANFVWIIVFALIAKKVSRFLSGSPLLKKAVTILVVVVVFNQLYFSYFRTQRLGRAKFAEEQKQAQLIAAIASDIKTGECYAGAGDESLSGWVPDIFLFRYQCPLRQGTPVTGAEILTRLKP